MKILLLIALVPNLSHCADEHRDDSVSKRDRGKFSDPKFLCDPSHLLLWDELRQDGTDLRPYGLKCGDDEQKSIVVRDSIVGEGDAVTADTLSTTPPAPVKPTPKKPGASVDVDPDENAEADSVEDPPPDQTPSDPLDEIPVTYTANLKVLIDEDCVDCHGPGGSVPRLDGYANAKAAGPASLQEIQNNTMPIGNPWSPADKALFLEWSTGQFSE